jgi:hypothetical protein
MDFEKLLQVLLALHDAGVKYVLVGAVGLTVHGIVRATRDVDLFVRSDEQNVLQLRAALQRVFPEDASIQEISAADLAGEYPAIRYNSPDGSLTIDLIARLGESFAFENLEYETRIYEGVPVCVATPRTLYEMKKDTVRLQDRADAQALKEEFDLGEE